MIIYRIKKIAVHNIHYKLWAIVAALVWWHIIHDLYQTTIIITVPIDNTTIALEEKTLTIHAQLNKFSYYAGYHTDTKFFLDKKPIHDIITLEKHAIITHPAVRVVAFYPTVVHVKKMLQSE